MKKNGILNPNLSRIIASMGHTDKLVICDSGLPIPRNKEIVDLALTKNIPRFIDTLRTVLKELKVESAVIAEEMKKENHRIFDRVNRTLSGIPIEVVPHEQFKEITQNEGTIAFVRTGEATPFANIILISGVTF